MKYWTLGLSISPIPRKAGLHTLFLIVAGNS